MLFWDSLAGYATEGTNDPRAVLLFTIRQMREAGQLRRPGESIGLVFTRVERLARQAEGDPPRRPRLQGTPAQDSGSGVSAAKPRYRDIVMRLSERQYEALLSANILMMEHMVADGPDSIGQGPHAPRSLDAADRSLRRAWQRAGMGF